MSGTIFQSHRNAEDRVAMGKVCGSVDRVDIPAVLGFHLATRALFAVDSVAGKPRVQTIHNEALAGPVGFRNQVGLALVLGLDSAFVESTDQISGFNGNRRRRRCELEVHLGGKDVHASTGSSLGRCASTAAGMWPSNFTLVFGAG